MEPLAPRANGLHATATSYHPLICPKHKHKLQKVYSNEVNCIQEREGERILKGKDTKRTSNKGHFQPSVQQSGIYPMHP